MFRAVSANMKVIVVAAVTAMVTAGGPAAFAAAYDAINADKVDGKHAVSAASTVEDRKGKLVATNVTTGQLPNNILAKALDANRLDGLDSTALILKEQVRHVSISAAGAPTMKSSKDITVGPRVVGSGTYEIRMPNHSNCVMSATVLGQDFGLARIEFLEDPEAGFLVHTANAQGVATDRAFDLLAFCRA